MGSDPTQPQWTKPQQSAIQTVDKNLLVCAAAGSGKTAVLAERCVYLVCDAPVPCDVDELLVVTFTEAAAAEMKSRIGSSLRRRAEGDSSARLQRQLLLVDHAQVSTLHGFCAKLLRQNFHLAGIDPAFRILDAEEAGLRRQEIAGELVRECYENERARGFGDFLDAYCDGDEQRLVKLLAKTHEMLCSVVDPNQWIRSSRQRLAEASQGRLEDSELGKTLMNWIVQGFDALTKQCDAALRHLDRLGGFPLYKQYIRQNLLPIVQHWQKVFASDGLDALAEEASLKFPIMPRVPALLPNKDLAYGVVDAVRRQMKTGAWRAAMAFTTAQWQDGLNRTLPHARTFLDLVGQFSRRYRAAKDAARALDFADLERMSLRILSDKHDAGKPSATALAYHRRFAHVLVDEYQDINDLQDALLSLLSHERVAHGQGMQPNAFYVGDVKQSIYRFRLAEPARFLQREKEWRAGGAHNQVIDLQENFRSRQPLLKAVNSVFERLMTLDAAAIAYDQSHRLVFGATFPPPQGSRSFSGSPIELHLIPRITDEDRDEGDDERNELDRTEREGFFIARRIRQLMGKEPGTEPMLIADRGPDRVPFLRPIRYSDIVILLRTMRYKSEQFAAMLQDAGIPAHADSVTGYFESMEVRDMLALLRILDNARQDIPLATLLRSPLSRVPQPEEAMARIRLAYPPGAKGDVPFHEAVVRFAAEQKDELAATINDLLDRIEQWREAAQRRAPDELVWEIYQESGFLAYCEGLANGRQRVANLLLLREKARQFAKFERPSLARFLKLLESLEDDADLGLPSTVTAAQDVVRIMSVHRSKGLEFPVVFLPDLGKRINLADCGGQILADKILGLGLRVVDQELFVRYPSLASTLVERRLRKEAMAEELRVLYVAMTRAKEHLILTGTANEKALDQLRTRWAGHRGAFPAESILSATTMLQWIVAVAAASGADSPAPFTVTSHTADEVAEWRSKTQKRSVSTPEELAIRRLEPLPDVAQFTPEAMEIISRLENKYPFEASTTIRAAQSVTGQAETVETPIPSVRELEQSSHKKALERPKFLLAGTGATLSATERGTATHLVLQHLDFTRSCDGPDIKMQIDGMAERRLLSPAESGAVNCKSLLWFVQSEVGQLLRRHAGEIRREIPVYFTVAGSDKDACDQPMIRGRLDLLLPLEDGHVIVDYKTDLVIDGSIQLRADEYRPQMELYRQAIQRITGKSVKEIYLIFLSAERVVRFA